ncbi:ABC transporter permease [Parenemella sanctibonifatiensis]|uniref:Peptide ABC transporter permease n=1 Tax=Parenemella sanctibonifatiensis TaxID=2016505 RepID=A0A255DXQ8_9ACTN|nr:ABC transporter permease [Parenemella sanctibonifatiensis]OYN84107.1 peptide ABC transporter permease [Parenemella sanctibonifatiensis]
MAAQLVVDQALEAPQARKVPLAAWLSAAVLVLLALAALVPGLLTSIDPLATNPAQSHRPPSAEHLFGTDRLGRDQFARVVHGARVSLGIGFIATGAAVAIAIVAGVLIGLAPRWIDGLAMRILEVVLAFPELLLALVVIALLGPGTQNVLIAITISAIPVYVRMVRIATVQVRTSGYVEAATALGVGRTAVVVRHVLPNVVGPLLVLATIGVGNAIIAGSAMSFLNLGPVAPTPEWGLMLSEGRDSLRNAWWVAVFPGLAITATVISTTVLGRHLQARFEGTTS